METTNKKTYRYNDKNDSKHILELEPNYLSAVYICDNASSEQLRHNKSEDKKDLTESYKHFIGYDIVASSIPEFVEPICNNNNHNQFVNKYAKALFLLKHFQYHFRWKDSNVYSFKGSEDSMEDRYTFVGNQKSEQKIDDSVCYGQISTNDTILLGVFNDCKDIHRTIQTLIEIGCISLKDDSYIVGKKSKTYFFYRNNIHKFFKWCEENNIPILSVASQYDKYVQWKMESSEDKDIHLLATKFKTENKDKVKVGKVHIKMVKNKKLTEMLVTEMLYEVYPQILELQRTYDYLYKTYYPTKDNSISPIAPFSRFNFVWSTSKTGDYISKISFRETTSYSSAPKHADKNIITRNEIRQKYELLADEYDVKASVPRLAIFLNTGMWVAPDMDIYEAIFYRYLELTDNDIMWNKSTRNIVKKAVLRSGFNTAKCSGHDINFELKLPAGDFAKQISNDAEYFHQAIVDVCGGEFKADIFVAESVIYHNVTYRLLDQGYQVWQIYDGFYCDELPSRQEMNQLVEDCAIEYYNNYMNPFEPLEYNVG